MDAFAALIIPELTALPGDSIRIPINITEASGVAGADITVTYDPDVLKIDAVEKTDLSEQISMQPNINNPGKVILAMAGATAIPDGSGAFVEMIFTVNLGAEIGTETPLSFDDAALYNENGENIAVGTQDGKVVITCAKGDVNRDGDVDSGDAVLVLRIAVELLAPTEWQKCAADMDDNGNISSPDATSILKKVAGLAAPGTNAIKPTAGNINVKLAEVHGESGERIIVPVKIDRTHNLAGGDINIAYDASVLRALKVSSDSNILLASNLSNSGSVRIAFAGAQGMDAGILAEIEFEVVADKASPLSFQQLDLHNPDSLPIISKGIGGEFRSWTMPADSNALLQNFPNPFNPETWIPYQLREINEVTVHIYNPAGKLVRRLDLGQKPAGIYTDRDRAAYWDGKNESGEEVSSGIYFYTMQAGDFSAVRKMIILK